MQERNKFKKLNSDKSKMEIEDNTNLKIERMKMTNHQPNEIFHLQHQSTDKINRHLNKGETGKTKDKDVVCKMIPIIFAEKS